MDIEKFIMTLKIMQLLALAFSAVVLFILIVILSIAIFGGPGLLIIIMIGGLTTFAFMILRAIQSDLKYKNQFRK
jgi:hypothetical protein